MEESENYTFETLVVYKCLNCNTYRFPLSGICHDCLDSRKEEYPLTGLGTIYSYSYMHSSSEVIPFVFADFSEGIRIFGRFEGKNLEIGKKVKVLYKKSEGDEKTQVFVDGKMEEI